MADDDDDRKTGIFYVKDPAGIVVMLDGEVTHRYKSKREFIEAHVKGMTALEREMADLLERHYKPEGSQ